MRARFFSTGTVIPAILLAALGSDVVLRSMPLEPFAFRPWEAAIRYHAPDAPFVANQSFRKTRAYGDLAALGDFPQDRQYRSETFTTDSWGYRNPPSASEAPPSGLLMGSSFAVGTGVNDEETLSAQLGRELRTTIYNAGGQTPELWRIRELERRLDIHRGVVLYEFLERSDAPVIPEGEGAPPPKPPLEQVFDRWGLERTYLFLDGWTAVSPLEVAIGRRYRALKDNRLLPKDLSGVIERPLRNGEPMLFLRFEAESLYQHRLRAEFIEYWRWLRKQLDADGLDLVVVLVPSKYTVYGDLLAQPDNRLQEGVSFLSRLETGLEDRGIVAVNLTGPLRKAAAEGVDERRYVFWRDDTHWNAAGIAVAAHEVARVLRSSNLPVASPSNGEAPQGPKAQE